MSKRCKIWKDDFDTCYKHGWLSVLGSGLNGAFGALGSIYASKTAGSYSLQATRETNDINKEIAEKNLALQQEHFDYQKALQQQVFEREDSAYQRTVNDMRAAGLSPLSMQSTNGAGEVISTTAPQNGFQAQAPAPMQAPDMSALSHMADGIAQAQDYFLRKRAQDTSDTVSAAQANLLNAQAAKEWTSANYQDAMLQQQLKKLGLENSGLALSNKGKELENDYNTTRNKYSGGLFAQQLASGNFGLQGQALDLMNALDTRDYEKTVGITDGMTPEERKAALMFYNLFGNTQNNHYEDNQVPYYDEKGNVTMTSSGWKTSNSEKVAKGISNMLQAMTAADAISDVIGNFNIGKLFSGSKDKNNNNGYYNNNRSYNNDGSSNYRRSYSK